MDRTLFQEFIQSETPEAKLQFLNIFNENRYLNLRYLYEELNESIRRAAEPDFAFVAEWIARARELIPVPGDISPYYQSAWDQLDSILAYKQEAFTTVPVLQRPGEWQILLNNPNTIDEVVCVPSLPFTEAAFLYGKYRSDLKKAEVLRLQKITDHITITG